jgi:mono/diheme cytochrome c family protein
MRFAGRDRFCRNSGFLQLASKKEGEKVMKYFGFSGLVLAATVGAAAAQDAQLVMGETLYKESCANCHGADLEGQPNWRTRLSNDRLPAPPLDASGHTWHHPDSVLIDITKHGPTAIVGNGYESDMPGFEGVLTDQEIVAIIDYIKSTWPERMRASQESRTLADEQAQP